MDIQGIYNYAVKELVILITKNVFVCVTGLGATILMTALSYFNIVRLPRMWNSSKREINIVLLGKTGEGKSSTGNTILGSPKFKSSTYKHSCTLEPLLESCRLNGVTINVVDTQGLCDNKTSNKVALQNIFAAMPLCPNGFDALLFVISYTGRCTRDDIETINLMKLIFGDRFLDHCILVFTHGINFDADENNMSFEKWCAQQSEPKELVDLLRDCGDRKILFYNKGDKSKQNDCVAKLIKMINNMNGRYCHEDFSKTERIRNELIRDRFPALQRNIQQKLSFIKTEIYNAQQNVSSTSQQTIQHLKSRVQELLDEIIKEDDGSQTVRELKQNVVQVKQKVENLNTARQNQIVRQLDQIGDLVNLLKTPQCAFEIFTAYNEQVKAHFGNECTDRGRLIYSFL